MNKAVFELNEYGDPVRTEAGVFRRVRNWRDIATDKLGRTFNKRVHGDEPALDEEGFLVVLRRQSGRSELGANTPLYDMIKSHERRRPGYQYRAVNDTPGRVERMQAMGYDITQGSSGPVRMQVGRGTQAVLMETPIEDFTEAQEAKVARSKAAFKASSQPNAKGEGAYYGEGATQDKKSRLV